MITRNLLKTLSILCIFLSVNSDGNDINSVPGKSNLNKQFSNGKPREYPMAPTEEELLAPGQEPEPEQEYNPGYGSGAGNIVVPISEDGVVGEPEGTPYNQNQYGNSGQSHPEPKPEQYPFGDILSSFLDPNTIQMFTEIMTKLVTSMLPLFGNGASFASGLYSSMSAMNVPNQVCNGVVGQCSKYFEQMKSNPDSIRPIMTRVLSETLPNLRPKKGIPQKSVPQKSVPKKVQKVVQKPRKQIKKVKQTKQVRKSPQNRSTKNKQHG